MENFYLLLLSLMGIVKKIKLYIINLNFIFFKLYKKSESCLFLNKFQLLSQAFFLYFFINYAVILLIYMRGHIIKLVK